MRATSLTWMAAAMLLTAPGVRGDEFKVIGTEELARKLAAPASTRDFTLVDTRTQVEYSEAHLPGAALIPARLIAAKLPALVKGKADVVVFYCNGPNCTKTVKAAKAAASIGYTNIVEYKEGLPGWARSGRKTEGHPLRPFDAPLVSPSDLRAALAGARAPLLIDIRDPEEYQAFHVAEAASVPLDEVAAWVKKAQAGRAIVIVDHAGHQTPTAARVLHDSGRSDVSRLDGGILKWQAQGLPVVRMK